MEGLEGGGGAFWVEVRFMARGPRTPGIGSMEQAAAGRAQHHHACTSTDHPQDRWTADMAARASQCRPLSGSRQGKDESSSAPKKDPHSRLGSRGCVGRFFIFPSTAFSPWIPRDEKGLPCLNTNSTRLGHGKLKCYTWALPRDQPTRPLNPKCLQHQINTTAELRPPQVLNLGGATGRAPTPYLIPRKLTYARRPRLLGSDISHTGEATLSTACPECIPAMSAQVPTYRKHARHAMALQLRNHPVVGVSPTCSHRS